MYKVSPTCLMSTTWLFEGMPWFQLSLLYVVLVTYILRGKQSVWTPKLICVNTFPFLSGFNLIFLPGCGVYSPLLVVNVVGVMCLWNITQNAVLLVNLAVVEQIMFLLKCPAVLRDFSLLVSVGRGNSVEIESHIVRGFTNPVSCQPRYLLNCSARRCSTIVVTWLHLLLYSVFAKICDCYDYWLISSIMWQSRCLKTSIQILNKEETIANPLWQFNN